MTVTRSTFEAVALAVRLAQVTPEARQEVARSLADQLAETNPRFDRDRFMKAATRGTTTTTQETR